MDRLQWTVTEEGDNDYSFKMPSLKTLEKIHAEKLEKVRSLIGKRYHLWVPFMLAVMASLFVLPYWFWQIYIAGSDVKLNNLSAIFRAPGIREDKRRRDAEKSTKKPTKSGWFRKNFDCLYSSVISIFLPRHDLFLVFMYVIVKILNVALIKSEMGILDKVFDKMGNDSMRVNDLFDHLFLSAPLNTTDLFPTDVSCDFDVRIYTMLKRFTMMCKMNVNHFNPVILSLVSSWLDLLYMAVVFDLVLWVIRFVLVSVGTVMFTLARGSKQSKERTDLDGDNILVDLE